MTTLIESYAPIADTSATVWPAVIQIGRALVGGRPTALLRRGARIETLQSVLGLTGDRLDPLIADWVAAAAALAAAGPGERVTQDAIGAFLPPLEAVPKLICIGTNYHDHIAEMGMEPPQYPYAFFKPNTTIAPPAGPVRIPAMSNMVDWEAELGVVIARQAKHVPVADALGYVAAYLPVNDVSARDWFESRPAVGVDWVMMKAHDGFTPMGPWLTLAAGIPDPQALPIQTLLNGVAVQNSSTSNMVFSVAEIIAHLSSIMTLLPGDVIATGTPAGVGFARKPRLFIADGDIVTVDLGPLGKMETRFVAA